MECFSVPSLKCVSQVCLVMELAKGGELFDKLLEFGSLQEPVAAKLMYQVNTFLSNKFNI